MKKYSTLLWVTLAIGWGLAEGVRTLQLGDGIAILAASFVSYLTIRLAQLAQFQTFRVFLGAFILGTFFMFGYRTIKALHYSDRDKDGVLDRHDFYYKHYVVDDLDKDSIPDLFDKQYCQETNSSDCVELKWQQ